MKKQKQNPLIREIELKRETVRAMDGSPTDTPSSHDGPAYVTNTCSP
jgi:hypothetical protein